MRDLMKLSLVCGLSAACSGVSGSEEPIPVESFVRQVFPEMVPYRAAMGYDQRDVPKLVAMLESQEQEAYWRNVVIVLGYIGDDEARQALIRFIARGDEHVLSPDEYRARTNAVIALGYLIQQSGDEAAVDYLVEGLRSSRWEKRVRWHSPYGDDAQRNERLTTLAVIGLGLSGHPAAVDPLHRVLRTADGAGLGEVVSEALKAHAIIARDGLAGYYQSAGR